jgi:signal transduction histidine kinase
LADQAAVAIENARLYHELHQRAEAEHTARQQAEMLGEATAALVSTLNLDEVLDSILTHLEAVLPYDGACVFLWDGEWLHAVAGRGGFIQQEVVGHRYRVDRLSEQDVDLTGHPFILINKLLGLGSNDSTPGWMGVPLTVRGKIIGYLTLDSQNPIRYGVADETLAQAFANQAAVAIQNARLFEKVQAGREQLQSLSHRLVEVQETERRQIARELHDEAGQSLTGLIVGLKLLARDAHQPDVVLSHVTKLEQTTDMVLENLHRLAINLRPAMLDHLGLVAALRQHIEDFSSEYGYASQFEVIGFDDKRLPPAVETTIYRIVQEALTNVIRHAQATRVDVVLKRKRSDNRRMITIIEDNGIGFDPEAVNQNKHLGLLGMRERAEMLGGSLTIESTVKMGTTIFVEVPNVYSHSYS